MTKRQKIEDRKARALAGFLEHARNRARRGVK